MCRMSVALIIYPLKSVFHGCTHDTVAQPDEVGSYSLVIVTSLK